MKQKILFETKKFNHASASVFFSDRKRYDDVFAIIKNLPKNSLIIFREYDLEKPKRQELAQEIINFAKKFGHKVLIGKDLQMALSLRAAGAHYSDHDKIPLALIKKKNLHKDFIFSYACHSLNSILQAKKLHNDLFFASPIFATKSHKDAKTLGLRGLRKIIFATKKPVFALGGINAKNITSLRSVGVQGFGAIGLFKNYN